MRRFLVVVTVAVGMIVPLGGTAFAAKPVKGGGGGGTSSSTGYDVSYPQCGGALPSSPAFGIVGVNHGIVYSPNTCANIEYAWAAASTPASKTQPKVSFYANTADPGPSNSVYWPNGQTTPQTCAAYSDTTSCSYDYGWYAAADSFKDAMTAAGPAPAAGAPWWLDVETANSWETNTVNNDADIQGALDYLKSQGVSSAGIYTNSYSFQTVMGATSEFAGHPSWVPGARTLHGAKANCTASITGGQVIYAQYPSGGFDADYACP